MSLTLLGLPDLPQSLQHVRGLCVEVVIELLHIGIGFALKLSGFGIEFHLEFRLAFRLYALVDDDGA